MIKVTFEAEDITSLKRQVADLLGESSNEEAAPAPFNKNRKKTDDEPAPTPTPTKKKKEEPATYDSARELLISIEGKADEKRALFADYGVKKLPEIPEDQLQDFYNDLKKLA